MPHEFQRLDRVEDGRLLAELGNPFDIDLDAIVDRHLVQCANSLAVPGVQDHSTNAAEEQERPRPLASTARAGLSWGAAIRQRSTSDNLGCRRRREHLPLEGVPARCRRGRPETPTGSDGVQLRVQHSLSGLGKSRAARLSQAAVVLAWDRARNFGARPSWSVLCGHDGRDGARALWCSRHSEAPGWGAPLPPATPPQPAGRPR